MFGSDRSLLSVRLGGQETETTPRSTPLILLALAATVFRARADEQRRDEPLGEVVVTAPPVREEAPPGDPTAFGTAIDTRDAPGHVDTLSEVLSDAVGVQVRRFGGLGDFSTVSIRGSSAGQVQVYLDGVPLGRGDNETVNLADLPLDAVERVEIYRGTTPLAFAQSGPGGIVNVVTRRPGDVPVAGVSTSYGSFDTRKVDVAGSTRVGPWEYLGFAQYVGTAGDFTFLNDLGTTANPADDRLQRRDNAGFNLGDLTGRIGWRPGGPVAATLTTDTFVKEQGVPGVGNVSAHDTSLGTVRQLGHLDVDLTPVGLPDVEATTGGWVLFQEQHFRDRQGEIALVPTDVDQHTLSTGLQTVVRAALGAHNAAGLFLGASHETFSEDDLLDPALTIPDRTRLRGTIAAEDEILPWGDRVSIVPAVRWEVFRDDFPAGTSSVLQPSGVEVRDFTSPHLGVRVAPYPALTLLGNIGRYAREPNLSELFGTRGSIVGNPRLSPEVAVNRDIGFRIAIPATAFFARGAVEYAYFENSIDDLIVLVQNSQRIVRPENVTSAAVSGHEVSARGELARRIGLALNYTHEDAHDDGDVTFLRGKKLPGRPADEAFAHMEFGWSPARPLPRLAQVWPGRVFYEVNVIADNFLDRANVQKVGSRVLHTAGIEIALPLPRTRAVFEVKNAGDDHTRDALGFPLPGRSFFLTVSYGLGRREEEAR